MDKDPEHNLKALILVCLLLVGCSHVHRETDCREMYKCKGQIPLERPFPPYEDCEVVAKCESEIIDWWWE